MILPALRFLSVCCCILGLLSQKGHAFDSLLNELSGSEADQLEGERAEKEQAVPEALSSLPPSEDLAPLTGEDAFAVEENQLTDGVTLQGLDKQTARVFILDAPLEKPIEFGNLKIVVHRCEKAPLSEREESMAFLTITETKPEKAPQTVFSGWMFSSSPALSALDHPVYDIWVKECKPLNKGKGKLK